jgi:NADH-quinone oxidoreductase subunit J
MVFLFYLLGGVALLSALMVVISKNPINSVIYLIVCFLAIAGNYILLNAQFLAVVHIIVYTGAIMVLFLFVIMLLNLNKENEPHKKLTTKLAAIISAALLLFVLLGAAKGVAQIAFNENFDPEIGLVGRLGKVLFTDYMLPFEVSSVLFLAAMVGAVMLGKKDVKKI